MNENVIDFDRKEFKKSAKLSLKSSWKMVALITFLYVIINIGVSLIPLFGFLASIALSGITLMGFYNIILRVSRNKAVNVDMLFEKYKYMFKTLGLLLMIGLFTFLWSLLLVIPGIIAGYRYSMALFIMADNPEIGILEAINQSKQMTKGYKWKLFVMRLSFWGWILLGYMTCGIGFLWIYPYMFVSTANAYYALKGEVKDKDMNEYETYFDN